jgi:microcystin degradation protein MlrC
MRIFSGAFATETNTFGPMPTSVRSFHERGYFRAGEHPNQMQMHSGPLWAARLHRRPDWTLIEGMVAAAVPNGLVTRQAYEALRDELLRDLQQALPVDLVLLGLHGAMAAEGYDDPEGDLLGRIRRMVGPATIIGATLDPHCHMSAAMCENADLLICWKEYPHTDILERAEDLLRLCLAMKEDGLKLGLTLVDTGIVTKIHTSQGEGRKLVDRVSALEGGGGILSVSIVHGFSWGDVPDMGTKILVYSDAALDPDGAKREALALTLARDIVALKGAFTPPGLGIPEALDEAAATAGPVVIADGADNAGGGAPSDSTYFLRALLDRKMDACLGPLWDPGAVALAFDAGIGARLDLRVGGKVCPLSGDPVDARWTVTALKPDMVMTGLAGVPAKLGDCALITSGGVDVVLTSIRCQGFNIDFFTQLGCDPATKKVVVVKSSQHFQASFSKIASRIIYSDAPGVVTSHLKTLPFRRVRLPRWPLTEPGPIAVLTNLGPRGDRAAAGRY